MSKKNNIKQKTKKVYRLAILSLASAVISIFLAYIPSAFLILLSYLFALIAIVSGITSLLDKKNRGKGMAIAGIIIGVPKIIFGILTVLSFVLGAFLFLYDVDLFDPVYDPSKTNNIDKDFQFFKETVSSDGRLVLETSIFAFENIDIQSVSNGSGHCKNVTLIDYEIIEISGFSSYNKEIIFLIQCSPTNKRKFKAEFDIEYVLDNESKKARAYLITEIS